MICSDFEDASNLVHLMGLIKNHETHIPKKSLERERVRNERISDTGFIARKKKHVFFMFKHLLEHGSLSYLSGTINNKNFAFMEIFF